MSETSHVPDGIGAVTIQLLDTASGRPIKSWSFQNQDRITIGRSPDQNVDISDPYVSRSHASFEYRDGQWWLLSLGRHGVLVSNERIVEYEVTSDVCFRLGTEGPTLRFHTNDEQPVFGATISFSRLPGPVLQLDEQKLQADVNEIVEADYFQNLTKRAKQLRRQRNENE